MADGRGVAPEVNGSESSAAHERSAANGMDPGNDHARQSSAPLERPILDGDDAAGNDHARQSTAPVERVVVNGPDAARDAVITLLSGGIIEKF